MSTNINELKFFNEIDSLQLNVRNALTLTDTDDIKKAWRDAAINSANLITGVLYGGTTAYGYAGVGKV
jgi:hypothetical protein